MGSGAMLVWFVLSGLSVAFISIDIRSTPAHPVLKWAFVILALFTGPLAAIFYVLGCREPLKETHEDFVAVRWRQVLGSTMHCAAGDGIGIIAGAALAAQPSEMVPDERPSHGHPRGNHDHPPAATTGPSITAKAAMTTLSIACLALGIALASWLNG